MTSWPQVSVRRLLSKSRPGFRPGRRTQDISWLPILRTNDVVASPRISRRQSPVQRHGSCSPAFACFRAVSQGREKWAVIMSLTLRKELFERDRNRITASRHARLSRHPTLSCGRSASKTSMARTHPGHDCRELVQYDWRRHIAQAITFRADGLDQPLRAKRHSREVVANSNLRMPEVCSRETSASPNVRGCASQERYAQGRTYLRGSVQFCAQAGALSWSLSLAIKN